LGRISQEREKKIGTTREHAVEKERVSTFDARIRISPKVGDVIEEEHSLLSRRGEQRGKGGR
jgi:hypothetical protein